MSAPERVRLPSGGLDVICAWLHMRLCYSAAVEHDDHTWRDHSGGRTYTDSAHRLVRALAERGLVITKTTSIRDEAERALIEQWRAEAASLWRHMPDDEYARGKNRAADELERAIGDGRE